MTGNANLASYLTRTVPRYTSYPTVPHFANDVGSKRYSSWLEALDPHEPVSLYLHVPFCRQLCWYCGCNMKLASRPEPVAAYAETLRKEIALASAALPRRLKVKHLHWGGGTPTALEPADLARAMACVREHFDFTSDAEIAIESDPRTLTAEMIRTIGRLGFNRASFGVQEFDPTVQKAINRIQPPDMVRDAVDGLRQENVAAINFDLIYGLPHQTVETLTRTIAQAAEMCPDRIALFGYAHVPWMAKKQRLIATEALPGASERIAQAKAAEEALVAAGYQAIGLDHFALPSDPLAIAARTGHLRRNFQGYTTDTADTLIGFGSTSIGRTPSGFVQNLAETGAWARAVEAGVLPVGKGHAFTGQDALRGAVIEALMCFGHADIAEISRRFGAAPDWWAFERDALRAFEADGIVRVDGSLVQVTPGGLPVVRTVAAVFDAYFTEAPARHSLAV